jgi:hypothetical protein
VSRPGPPRIIWALVDPKSHWLIGTDIKPHRFPNLEGTRPQLCFPQLQTPSFFGSISWNILQYGAWCRKGHSPSIAGQVYYHMIHRIHMDHASDHCLGQHVGVPSLNSFIWEGKIKSTVSISSTTELGPRASKQRRRSNTMCWFARHVKKRETEWGWRWEWSLDGMSEKKLPSIPHRTCQCCSTAGRPTSGLRSEKIWRQRDSVYDYCSNPPHCGDVPSRPGSDLRDNSFPWTNNLQLQTT